MLKPRDFVRAGAGPIRRRVRSSTGGCYSGMRKKKKGKFLAGTSTCRVLTAES